MHQTRSGASFPNGKITKSFYAFCNGSDFSNFVPDLTVSSPKFTDKFKNFGLESWEIAILRRF